MRADSRESFRKWATLIVSALALLVTCLRDPLVLTLKSTVREVIRDEMDRYEKAPPADARQTKRSDTEAATLKNLEQEIAAIRDLASRNEAEHRTWLQVNNCLVAMEAKLDLLTKEHEQKPKPQKGDN